MEEFIEIPGPGAKPEKMRTLFYDQSSGRTLHIVASLDGMRVFAHVETQGVQKELKKEEIFTILEKSGVSIGVSKSGVALFASRCSEGRPMPGYVQIARGEPMRQGENGSIEFHVRPSDAVLFDGLTPEVHPDIIENCFSGQRVATILPPGSGRPGRNVFGDIIDARPGNPLTVQAGNGIKISPNGKEFTSQVEGRLVFENNILSVSTVLEIPRDVDATVGSINFVGRIVINGSVDDGMEVEGGTGVTIGGDVGAARIVSRGDVKINGCMKGGTVKASIKCRNLYARQIENAVVDASGNVLAASGISKSDIHCKGQVSVLNGSIESGLICALGGIGADIIGTLQSEPLTMMAGLDWDDECRKEEIQQRINEFLERIEDSRNMLTPLFSSGDLSGKLSVEQKNIISELITELRFVREDLTGFLEERAELSNRVRSGSGAKISVKTKLNSGVIIRFPGFETEVPKTVPGPVNVLPDAARGLRLERGIK